MTERPLARIALASLMAVFTAQTAYAQTPCLTSGEARTVVSAALPDLVVAISNKCRPSLPPSAYLAKSGGVLADRFKATANTAWPAAKLAVLKVGGDRTKLLATLPDETSRALLSVGINAAITNGITTENCTVTNRIMAALDPLPPANFADAFSAVIESQIGRAKPGGKEIPFKICPAPLPLAATSKPKVVQ
jgi:hypothetical protein